MKINWKYLKNPKIIIGAVILFLVVLWMLNRGAGASPSGSNVVTNSGPTDAQVAAQTQLAMAGIAASVANNQTVAGLQAIQEQGDIAIALKTIDANTASQVTAAQQYIAAMGIAAQSHAADLSYAMGVSNNELAFNTAKMAYDSANYSTAVNAGLTAQLSHDQLVAYQTGTLANLASTLKPGQKDQAFAELTYSITGSGGTYNTGGANPVYVPPSSGMGSGAITYAPPPLPQTNWVG